VSSSSSIEGTCQHRGASLAPQPHTTSSLHTYKRKKIFSTLDCLCPPCRHRHVFSHVAMPPGAATIGTTIHCPSRDTTRVVHQRREGREGSSIAQAYQRSSSSSFRWHRLASSCPRCRCRCRWRRTTTPARWSCSRSLSDDLTTWAVRAGFRRFEKVWVWPCPICVHYNKKYLWYQLEIYILYRLQQPIRFV
jgi:hypothetical protein